MELNKAFLFWGDKNVFYKFVQFLNQSLFFFKVTQQQAPSLGF